MPCRRWNSQSRALAGELEHRGDGVRVVGRELRIERVAGGEQPLDAGEIGDVGRELAGVDRIAVEAALLAALDLAVPIGALDQPHHQPPPAAPGEIGEPVEQRQRALLIGLDGEAEPVPAGERRGRAPMPRTRSSDRSSRSASSASMVKPMPAARGLAAPAPAGAGASSRQHPVALRHLVARMQRRQLDRDARRLGRRLARPRRRRSRRSPPR